MQHADSWSPIAAAVGERYPVNVRYARDLRDNLFKLSHVLVPVLGGAQIPLAQVADITVRTGPSMIKNEAGFLAGYVYVDVTGRDIGGYVEDARRAVARGLHLPAGYELIWSGQYEYLQRVIERLWIVVPITLAIVILLLFFNTGSIIKTIIILLAVPFSAVGAIWFLYLLNYLQRVNNLKFYFGLAVPAVLTNGHKRSPKPLQQF